jgi:hypothetical protein
MDLIAVLSGAPVSLRVLWGAVLDSQTAVEGRFEQLVDQAKATEVAQDSTS